MVQLSKPTRQRTAHHRQETRKALPAYGVADGVLSFRFRLTLLQRQKIDEALAIVGGFIREPGAVYESPCAVKTYMQMQLGAEAAEQFAVLYLDSQHRGIAFENHFKGGINSTNVFVGQLARAAMRHEAAAVVLAHNHPSGMLRPSLADQRLTSTIKSALALIEVRVLDHIIVAGDKAESMAEQGLL